MKFLNPKCSRCNKNIPQEDQKINPPYWICECGKKNYKNLAKVEHYSIINRKKKVYRKTKIRCNADRSIMEKQTKRWSHCVLNKGGQEIHKKHLK